MERGYPDDSSETPKHTRCFFFSYARKDRDKYLDRFFDDLCDRIAQMGALDREEGEVSFRDLVDIELGDDWERELAEALRSSQALVSIYTPWYFIRSYCGKEFQIFLNRQTDVRYENGIAKNSRHIVPVLWLKKKDLDRKGLPPLIARSIQYSIGQHQDDYEKLGLRRILEKKGPRGIYSDIVEALADRLLDLHMKQPLLKLQERPSLRQTPDAFQDSILPVQQSTDEEEARSQKQSGQRQSGPNVLVPFYFTSISGENNEQESSAYFKNERLHGNWLPFHTTDRSISLLINEVAYNRGFDCYEPVVNLEKDSVEQDMITTLRGATERNMIPLLVINPQLLASEEFRLLLRSLLDDTGWRGGVVIPIEDNHTAQSFLSSFRKNWRVPDEHKEKILVQEIVGSHVDFEEELVSMLAELLRRVVRDGQVQRRAMGTGPLSKPSIQSPGKRRRDGR